jgi:hypothetical protein
MTSRASAGLRITPSARPVETRKKRISAAVFIGICFSVVSMVLSASAANAVTLYTSESNGSAYYRASQGIYNGSLRVDGIDSNCWEMQRRTSDGAWVTSGFHAGSVTGDSEHIVNCLEFFQSTTWHIVNPSAVYGLRFIDPRTGRKATFCASKADCLNLS